MTPSVTQFEFRQAVFDPDRQRPTGLSDGLGQAAGKRFDVYRNNVIVSLKDAMTTGFPAVAKLLGAANFSALTSHFVRAHPPEDPRLVLYGDAFPEFLNTLPDLSDMGYLADVARLELALRSSYHAQDAVPMDPAILAALPPEQLADATLSFAPALRVQRSDWPVLEIYHYAITPGAPAPTSTAQDVLITRPEYDPQPHVLSAGGVDLITHLASAHTLGTALDAVHGAHPDFDFPALLGLLLQHGAITAVTLADPNTPD